MKVEVEDLYGDRLVVEQSCGEVDIIAKTRDEMELYLVFDLDRARDLVIVLSNVIAHAEAYKSRQQAKDNKCSI